MFLRVSRPAKIKQMARDKNSNRYKGEGRGGVHNWYNNPYVNVKRTIDL